MIPFCKKDEVNRTFCYGEDKTGDWSTINIPITLEPYDVYDFVIHGYFQGAGEVCGNMYLIPITETVTLNRLSQSGYYCDSFQNFSNNDAKAGLCIAKGYTGNHYLYRGTLVHTGRLLQTACNGGIINDPVSINMSLNSIIGTFDGNVNGLTLYCSSTVTNSNTTRFILTKRYPI